MVKLNRIYTRSGDDGTTGLADGSRRRKSDLRIDAFGTVDETNAQIGIVRQLTGGDRELDTMLARIQNDLFDLGADLATPQREARQGQGEESLRITAGQVEWLEGRIDELNRALEPLTSFVLPGGTPVAAALHVCRTVSRRAERCAVRLVAEAGESVNPQIIRYLNRLSDFFFVAARHANDGGAGDVLWRPGENR